MTGRELLAARFPGVPLSGGHYESMYLKACHPTEPLGLWVRYTVRKAPGAAATGSVWVTLFEADGPTAVKATSPEVDVPTGSAIRIGPYGELGRDRASGAVAANGSSASWDLVFSGGEPALEHLPAAWMYAAPLPRTKSTSPRPDLSLSGTATVNGRTISLDGWRGMLGHNWGTEHAHRWIWIQGSGFADSPGTWLDVVLGRLRIGQWTTPWLASGVVDVDGVRHRVGGPARVRRTHVDEAGSGCELVLPGRGRDFGVHVEAPRERFVGWRYADPAGVEHQVRNCSIASMTLDVGDRVLSTSFGATYELGTAEFDPTLEMQPYADA